MERNARVAGKSREERENIGLHRFALLTACCTAFLIFVGGLVTSTESGLAVPDWPLSYGMFFPPMVGGIFYEHGHRMVASFVGFLTVILAIWTWRKEPRAWVRWLSLGAVGAVVIQGVLGGITVLYLLPTPISVAHACLAQTFFCLTIGLAMFTSPNWKRGLPIVKERREALRLPILCAATTGVIYVQLILGALMRHTNSGLSIPDFPLAFGRIMPPFTSNNVLIHFSHRVGALAVTIMIVWTYLRVSRGYAEHPLLRRPATVMLALVCIQLTLGAFTIWTAKAVAITTLHVATGALVLGTSFVLMVRAFAMVRDREPAVVYPIREAAWR